MDVKDVTDAALNVGQTHGFAALMVVVLLLVLAAVMFLVITTHIRMSERLTTAQENSYKASGEFATKTASATEKMADAITQMSETTKILQKSVDAIVTDAKVNRDAVEQLLRRSELAQQVAFDVLMIAAEQIDVTDRHKADTLRRIANTLVRHSPHHQHGQ